MSHLPRQSAPAQWTKLPAYHQNQAPALAADTDRFMIIHDVHPEPIKLLLTRALESIYERLIVGVVCDDQLATAARRHCPGV